MQYVLVVVGGSAKIIVRNHKEVSRKRLFLLEQLVAGCT